MRMLCATCRLLLSGALLVGSVPGAVSQLDTDMRTLLDVEECPLVASCCEEDCCGKGTSWHLDTLYCVLDEESDGFNGTYSEAWIPGCVERVCCNQFCCSSTTKYDEEIASCVPATTKTSTSSETSTIATDDLTTTTTMRTTSTTSSSAVEDQPTATKTTPEPAVAPPTTIPGPIGSKYEGGECENHSDCISGYCFKLYPVLPGRCSCNPENSSGCGVSEKCASPEAIAESRGRPEKPFCSKPFGADCSANLECLTGNCDSSSNLCGCSPHTSFGCDVESGERCTFSDTRDGNFCKLREPVGTVSIGDVCQSNEDCESGYCFFLYFIQNAPLESPRTCLCNTATHVGCNRDAGEFCVYDEKEIPSCKVPSNEPIGNDCVKDSDCISGACFVWTEHPDKLGTCLCNPETGYGCDGDFFCASEGERMRSRGAVHAQVGDYPHGCFLPFGARCDGYSHEDCLGGDCDKRTKRCGCNDPCIACSSDDECDSGSCHMGPKNTGDAPGFCVCNTTTNAGCEGEFICASVRDVRKAQSSSVDFPFCYLPIGANCVPGEENRCLSDNCDRNAKVCMCNLGTHYGCDIKEGERCTIVNDQAICKPPDPKDVGRDCKSDSDCVLGYCFKQFPFLKIGTCSCNVDTGEGCDGDFECTSWEVLNEARDYYYYGYQEATPGCHLPIGASCNWREAHECLTGVCNRDTGTCGCSTDTSFGCDVESGERCLPEGRNYVCKNQEPVGPGSFGGECESGKDCQSGTCSSTGSPSRCTCDIRTHYGCDKEAGEICSSGVGYEPVCKVLKDEPVGNECINDSDCQSGVCFYDSKNPDALGFCVCNTETGFGCDGGFVCASQDAIIQAQGDVRPPGCYLPFGSRCTQYYESDCLTGTCDKITYRCACNSLTDWPCDKASGETCALEDLGQEGLTYVCTDDPICDGLIGCTCAKNSNCDSNNCEGSRCRCNPSTNAGCEQGFICDYSGPIGHDYYPRCYLPNP